MASPITVEHPSVECGTEWAGDPTTGELLALIVRAARRELDAVRCAVHLVRADSTLQRVATAGAAEPPDDRIGSLRRALLLREAAATGRPARADVGTAAVPVAVGAVPLLVDGEVRGVLEVDRGSVEPSGGDGRAVAGFAALAEAALADTGHRQRLLTTAEQVHRAARLLNAAVLDGATIDEVVHRLGDLLGRAVAVLGTDLRVRTWTAPPPLGLTAPPGLPPDVRDALERLGPERPSVLLDPDPVRGLTRRHLLAVLVVDGERAGFLDVIEMGRPLDAADAPVAEHAAAVLSLLMAADARADRAAAQTRDDVLADLFRGARSGDDLRRLALHVGLDLRCPHLLVRLPVAPGRSAAGCRDLAAAAVSGVLDAPPAAVAESDAVVLLVRLAADPGPPALRALHRALRTVLDAVAAATGVRRAVVSGVCREVSEYPAALAETREVDAIVGSLGGRADVVPVTELSTLRLVVSGDRAGVAVRFAEQCIGPLRRSDGSTGGDLVETLRSYLASGAQVRATAKALGVHENTVRYRLGRIEHVTGLDMRRFDALLAAQLAFQIEGLASVPEGDR